MQRPILVLVLVLAALGALLFGVLGLLREPDPPVAPGPNPTPSATANANPGAARTTLETDPARGGARASDATARERANEESAYRYDNGLEGQVVDGAGTPVASVKVTLTTFGAQPIFFYNDPRTPVEQDRHAETGADGRFAFDDVEPRDKYRLLLVHPDYARLEHDTLPIPPQGVVTEAPIVLFSGGLLTGTIRDEGNKPVANATVTLDGQAYQVSPYEPPDRLTTRSNEQGEYTLAHVTPGSRILTVRAAGYGTANVPGIEFEKDTKATRDVVLKAAQRICGRAVGADGKGIPDVKVLAIGFNSAQQSARVEALTDKDGQFCLEGLLPGKYNVLGTARGWRFKGAQSVLADAGNVVLHATREADACGRVVDADTGQPIQDFQVRLRIAYEENPVTQPIPDSLVSVAKAANGEFCIPGVQATSDGGYVVEATAPGYAPGFTTIFAVEQGRSVQGLEVRLGHGGTLTGRVVDADGKPVARALVQTHDNEWALDVFTIGLGADYPTQATSAAARTDAQGLFTLKNLTPEVYQITVEAAGFCAFEQKGLRVGFGETNNVGDVRLARGGSIQGRLLDPSGKGYANGQVQLEALEGDRPRSYRARTGADGAFTLSNVVPGTYRMSGTSTTPGANPLEDLLPQRASERQITVADGDQLTGIEVTLGS